VAALWPPVAAAVARLTLRRPVYARDSMAHVLAPPSQKSPSRNLPRKLLIATGSKWLRRSLSTVHSE